MDRLIEIQMANIEKAYESIPMGGKLEFSKSAIEGIHQVLRELKEYKDLEQKGILIKLPCVVGDTIYIIGKCKDFPPKLDGTMWVPDGEFGTATGYYCPYEESDLCPFSDLEDCSFAEDKFGIFEDVVCHICIEENKMWYVCENSNGYEIEDFGNKVFLTHEAAKLKLTKGE